ncbi:MAG: GDP-L-fucose synthase [Verrucomicrobia bacterium]|nr:GDP-L-fucose synthase [Verrucomicrobiota bacterium]
MRISNSSPRSGPASASGSRMKIFVAGHRGMVGSAVVRALEKKKGVTVLTRTRQQLDLTDPVAVDRWFSREKPDQVIDAAARVGGILENSRRPVEFLLDNLRIQNNVMESAFRHGCRKLLFLGSSCIYPKHAPQPIPEDSLLTGPLESTNDAYALAKIAGIRLAQAYRDEYGKSAISAMPTNLYGPGDNFDPETSHALPGMITKFHRAKIKGEKEVVLWGTGSPRREWLHVDDLAAGLLVLLEKYDGREIVNVGVGEDLTIQELAEKVKKAVGFAGTIRWDSSKPDGTPRKLLDVTRIAKLGWKPSISVEEGIASTYPWFLQNAPEARA